MRKLTEAERSQRMVEKREYNKEWNKNHPEQTAAKYRRWRLAHPEQAAAIARNSQLKKDYGITQEKYDAILKSQGGHCAFFGCMATEAHPGKGDALCVDHDHKTGKVRGLLCSRHNSLVGYAHDSVDELKNAIQYLQDQLSLEELNGLQHLGGVLTENRAQVGCSPQSLQGEDLTVALRGEYLPSVQEGYRLCN